jgi:hypothetical protein
MNTFTTRYALYAPSCRVGAGPDSYYEFAQHGFNSEAAAIEFVTRSGWALNQVVIKPYDATDEIEMEAFYDAPRIIWRGLMIIHSAQAKSTGAGPCDACHTSDHSLAYAAVAQDATGRHCEVMWICKPCAIKWAGGEEHILTTENARELCNYKPGAYADF